MDNWNSEREILLKKINSLTEEIRVLKGPPRSAKKQLKYLSPNTPEKSACNTPQNFYSKIRYLKEEQKTLTDLADAEKRALEKEISDQKEKYELIIKDLKHNKSTLLNEKKQLEKTVNKLTDRITNLEQSAKKCVTLSSELNKERFERKKLLSELGDNKKKRNDMANRIERLHQQIKELKEENKTIKVDTPHKRSSPVINKYEAEISDLKEQNEILKRYQVNAENVIESLKMKIEEFGEHEKMFTSLTSALKASEEETVHLRADFENLYKSKEAYVQMVNDLKIKLSQLTGFMESKKHMDMLCWNEKDQLFKELIVLKDQHKTTRTELEHLRESRKIESDLRKILVQANHKKDLIKSKCSSSEGTPSDPKTYTEIQMEFGARKRLNFEDKDETAKTDGEYFDCMDVIPIESDMPKDGVDNPTNITNAQIVKLAFDIDALRTKYERLKADKCNIEKELTAKIKYLEESIEATKSTYEMRIKNLLDENKHYNVRNANAETMAEEKEKQASLKELNKYKAEIDSSGRAFLKLNSDYKELKKEKENYIFEKDKEISNLLEKLKQQEKKIALLIEESNKKDSIFNKERTALQKRTDQLQTGYALLEGEKKFWNIDKDKDVSKLLEKVQMQENKIAELSNIINEKEAAFNEDRREFQYTIATLEAEYTHMKSVIEKDGHQKMCKLQEQIRNQEKTISKFEADIVLKEEMCSDLTKSIEALKSDYSFLTEEKVISDTDFQEKFDELLERTKNQENRITELMKEIKRKDIECADYEKAMEELKLDHSSLLNELRVSDKEKQEEISMLREKLKNSGDQIAALRLETDKKKIECVNLEKSIEKLNSDHSSLLNELRVSDKEKQDEISMLREKLKNSEDQITALRLETDKKKIECVNFEKSIDKLNSDHSSLLNKLRVSNKENQEKISMLREKLKNSEDQIAALRLETDKKKIECVNFEKSVDKLNSALENDDKLIIEQNAHNKSYELENKLKARNETILKLTTAMERIVEERPKFRKCIKTLQSVLENDKLIIEQDAQKKNYELDNTLKAEDETVLKLTTEMEMIVEEQPKFIKAIKILQSAPENDKLKVKQNVQTKEYKLENELNAKENTISELTAKVEKIVEERPKFLKAINILQSDISRLKNEKTTSDAEHQKIVSIFQEKLKVRDNKIQDLTMELAQIEKEYVENKKSLDKSSPVLEMEIMELEEILQYREQQLISLTEELNKKDTNRADLEKSVKDLKIEYDALVYAMKVLRNEQEAEMATLAGKLQEGEEKRTKQLTIKLSEKDADCAKHKSIIDNLKLEIANINDEKARLKADLEDQLRQFSEQTKNQNEPVKSIQNQDENVNQIQSLADVITPLKDECSRLKNENIYAETLLKDQIIRLENQVSINREKLAVVRKNETDLKLELFRKGKALDDCQIDIRILNRELKDTKASLDGKTAELKRLRENLIEQKSERESFEKELEKATYELGTKNDQLTLLSDQVASKDTELQQLQHKLNEESKQYIELQKEYDSLKDATIILEEQVIEFEKMLNKAKNENIVHDEQKKLLQEELEKKTDVIKSAMIKANEEISLRAFAESKLTEMGAMIENLELEISSLKSEIQVKSTENENLQSEVVENANCISILEHNLNNYEEALHHSNSEIANFKRERTKLLTELYELREDNTNLLRDLQTTNDKLTNAENEILQLKTALSNLEIFREEENLINETTLKQQSKLIDYVRCKLNTDTKKKKTFTDKLFKPKQKENSKTKDDAYFLELERQKSRALQAELYKSRLENYALRNNTSSIVPRLTTLKKLGNTSGCTVETPDFASSGHRFEKKLCDRSDIKCFHCDNIIPQTRISNHCIRCHLYAHTACSGFSDLPKCTNNQLMIKIKGDDTVVKRGLLKLFDHKCWIPVLVHLTNSQLLLYDNADSEEEPKPKINVFLDNVVAVSDRTETESSQSFIITVKKNEEVITIMLMTDDKADWLKAINATILKRSPVKCGKMVQATTNVGGPNNDLEEENEVVLEQYSILDKCNVKINCIVQLSSKVCVIGAERGLYSLKLPTSENNTKSLVLLSAGYSVQKINVLKKLRIVLFICAKNGVSLLMKCDLRELLINAEASECSRPSVKLDDAISMEDFENCSIVTTICDFYIAIALPTYIAILEWDQTSTSFSTVKQAIETKTAVVAMVYTATRLLFATSDGFFSSMLSQLQTDVEKITVVADNQQSSVNCYPVDILKVSKNKFLACTNLFGIYLDEQCKQIKKMHPIKWYSVPRKIVFNDPFIMTSHESYVTLMYPTTDTNAWTHKIITLNDPVILGISNYTMGGIYLVVKEQEEDGTEYNKCILFDSTIVRNRHKISWTSCSTPSLTGSAGRMTDELNISSSDLSISSSMFGSIDEKNDDVGNYGDLPRKKKVCFKISIRRSTSLPSLNEF